MKFADMPLAVDYWLDPPDYNTVEIDFDDEVEVDDESATITDSELASLLRECIEADDPLADVCLTAMGIGSATVWEMEDARKLCAMELALCRLSCVT